MVFSLTVGLSSVEASQVNCYLGACVGDQAVNIQRDYQDVTIIGLDFYGKFVLRFDNGGGIGGGWDRADIALKTGCQGDLCVGYPAFNLNRNNQAVMVYAIQYDGRYVLRYNDTGGVGGNWNRWNLGVAWGCFGGICVNDIVFNRAINRQAVVAAIQSNMAGYPERFLLNYSGALGGNWGLNDLVLISHGTSAYPPGSGPMPGPIPAPVPAPLPRDWTCSITKFGQVFVGQGPTRGAATTGALRQCALRVGRNACYPAEAFCSQ